MLAKGPKTWLFAHPTKMTQSALPIPAAPAAYIHIRGGGDASDVGVLVPHSRAVCGESNEIEEMIGASGVSGDGLA